MLLDIGVGILLSIFTSNLFGLSLTGSFLISGIIFSLFADIDYIFHLIKGGDSKNAYKHRYLLHYPLLYIPAGIFVISFSNPDLAILFGFCSFAHFLHDSIGIGWGIQWLYPFKKDHYMFLYRYTPPHKERLPWQIIYIWRHDDIDALARKYGDEDWIRNIYWRWHPYAIIEFLTFIIALIVLYFSIR
ncbi:MAG: metal-dependent hydrolase [Candidatus Colwellbacteria bacterium]|nr:metal-dependent hydrolase [Candidatus Colwellbacteria bacterium]